MYTDRIGKAIQTASICHENQYRKNPEKKLPYISHPFAVGMMLSHYGFSEDVIIAGILHDTVEDTAMTLQQIEKEFGPAVAVMVCETSEPDKTLSWEDRKRRYIEHLKIASMEAKAISCCDKIHNMKSMIESLNASGDIWCNLKRGKDEQIERFAKMLEIFSNALKKEMVTEYEAALNMLKERR